VAAAFRPRKDPRLDVAGGTGEASMWPRPFGRGRGEPAFTIMYDPALQCGRGLSAAEGSSASTTPCSTSVASMWPRPFGRGRRRRVAQSPCAPGASMWPRPFGRGRRRPYDDEPPSTLLQCGRGLSAAEGEVTIAVVCTANRFNVAAAFRPRKASAEFQTRPSCVASMWPRPFGRGRRLIDPKGWSWEELQCGRGLSAAEGARAAGQGRCHASFNVAAAFRPRKAGILKGSRFEWVQLQCGRGLSAAEGVSSAVTLLPSFLLQCGRGLSAAEGVVDFGHRRWGVKASMWPRPFGRGRQLAADQKYRPRTASMWPRPFGRGRPAASEVARSAPSGFNVAAAFRPRKGVWARVQLHDQATGFNVAAAFRPRKVHPRNSLR